MGFTTRVVDWLGKQMTDAEPVATDAYGKQFTASLYFKELAIFMAVSYIANTISKCEIKTYVKGEEVKDNLYYLLNVNPNPNQSSSQFMNKLVETYYYKHGALVVPYRNRLYVSDGFSLNRQPLKDDLFENVTVEEQVLTRPFKASKVFYFKLDNRSVLNLVDGMYGEYGQAISAALQRFKSTNAERYKLVIDNIQAGDPKFAEQFDTVIKKNLETFINSDKAVYPQFRGYDLQQFNSANAANSSDIINLRKETFEYVAQAFKIPLSMMQGNITNMNEIVKVYLSICIDPLAQMISEELTRKTTDYESWKAGDRVVVDTSTINHVDILDVADNIDKLIASGAFTIDQVLKRCGYDTLDTDFSTAHFLTKNYGLIQDEATALEGGDTNGTA